MKLKKKYFSFLREDAINRFYKYLQIDEIKSDYDNIDFELLKPDVDYISINYKDEKDDIYISSFSVTIDVFYKNSTVPCGYYKSFYNFDEFKNEFECIDEILSLFIHDFQF